METRQIPPKSAALIVSQETSDGFLDLRVVSPEGEVQYNGIDFAEMSSQHIAVVEALELLTTYLFDSDPTPITGPELISIEDLDI
jgi:hypothetical protein